MLIADKEEVVNIFIHKQMEMDEYQKTIAAEKEQSNNRLAEAVANLSKAEQKIKNLAKAKQELTISTANRIKEEATRNEELKKQLKEAEKMWEDECERLDRYRKEVNQDHVNSQRIIQMYVEARKRSEEEEIRLREANAIQTTLNEV